jgi:hypothetical protein
MKSRSPLHVSEIFPKEEEKSSQEAHTPSRKKSVKFDEQIEAPASRSRSNSLTSSPRSVLKRSADAEEIQRFARKMSQVKMLLERLRKGDSLTKYYE